jgi:hypothetical protein
MPLVIEQKHWRSEWHFARTSVPSQVTPSEHYRARFRNRGRRFQSRPLAGRLSEVRTPHVVIVLRQSDVEPFTPQDVICRIDHAVVIELGHAPANFSATVH